MAPFLPAPGQVVQQYGLAHARVTAHRGGGRLVEPLGVHTLTPGCGPVSEPFPQVGYVFRAWPSGQSVIAEAVESVAS